MIELHVLAGGWSKKVTVRGRGYARIEAHADGVWRGWVSGGTLLAFPSEAAAHAWFEAKIYECVTRTRLSVVLA